MGSQFRAQASACGWAFAVQPGDSGVVAVQVFNTGEQVERVRISVAGRAAAWRWSTVEPAELAVYPEKAESCSVRSRHLAARTARRVSSSSSSAAHRP